MKGTRNKAFPQALPTIDVETEQDARDLQIYFGRLADDGRYIYTGFKQTLEALDEATAAMKEFYSTKMKNNSQK